MKGGRGSGVSQQERYAYDVRMLRDDGPRAIGPAVAFVPRSTAVSGQENA